MGYEGIQSNGDGGVQPENITRIIRIMPEAYGSIAVKSTATEGHADQEQELAESTERGIDRS